MLELFFVCLIFNWVIVDVLLVTRTFPRNYEIRPVCSPSVCSYFTVCGYGKSREPILMKFDIKLLLVKYMRHTGPFFAFLQNWSSRVRKRPILAYFLSVLNLNLFQGTIFLNFMILCSMLYPLSFVILMLSRHN